MTKSDPLRTKHIGHQPYEIITTEFYKDDIIGPHNEEKIIDKVDNLRYGTNPSQPAAYYGRNTFLGSMKELKTGKGGLSLTNLEDILYAALTLGYFDRPSAIVMKHENPSGFATQNTDESLATIYRHARDADFRAAFGSVVLFNLSVDIDTANAIHETFVEAVGSYEFHNDALELLKSKKRDLRVIQYDKEKFRSMARFDGDKATAMKILPDGTLIRENVFTTPIHQSENLLQYVKSKRGPAEQELHDLLTAYYVGIRLRSNSVVMVKNGCTVGIGTGQQDRVNCVKLAIDKNKDLHKIEKKEQYRREPIYVIEGASLASDGFFPFEDSIELAHSVGVKAVLAPHGGGNFDKVLRAADKYDMVFVDLPGELRFFDHH